jgi:HEPN domain-containing protein
VEKLLKALIVRTGTFPPRTHDLGDLLETQPPVIRDDPHVASACALLTALWPRSRYPELPEPTPGEARQAIAAARAVRLTLAPFLHHGDQDRSAAQSESQ